MYLPVNHSSFTSALASRGQNCPQHGFLCCHDHPCLLHMRLWALAWASGPVQKVDVDHWTLRPHNRYDLNFFSSLLITMKYCFIKEPKINKQTYKMEITMKVLNSHFQKKKKGFRLF